MRCERSPCQLFIARPQPSSWLAFCLVANDEGRARTVMASPPRPPLVAAVAAIPVRVRRCRPRGPGGRRYARVDWGKFTCPTGSPSASATATRSDRVDNQATGIPVFGAQQRQGTTRAVRTHSSRLNIECALVGPATTNPSQQLAELETLLTGKQVDCLWLQSGSRLVRQLVNKYVDAGSRSSPRTAMSPAPSGSPLRLERVEARQAERRDDRRGDEEQGITPTMVAMGSGNPNAPWARSACRDLSRASRPAMPMCRSSTRRRRRCRRENFTIQEVSTRLVRS